MASGEVHAKSTLALVIPAGVMALGAGSGIFGAIACSGGVLCGVLLSPDLDVNHRTHSEYIVYRYLGSILGAVWFAFWYPYARLIPHRHALSHFPVLGTLGRLFYLWLVGSFVWVGWVLLVTGSPPAFPALPVQTFFNWGWAVGGLVLSDTLHYILDIMYTASNSRRRRRKNWWKMGA